MDGQTPDATRIFSLLRKLAKGGKQSAEETHELVELIETMAATNVIERLESKMDAQNNTLEVKLTSLEKNQDARYKMLAWVIGIVGGVITVVISIAMFVLER